MSWSFGCVINWLLVTDFYTGGCISVFVPVFVAREGAVWRMSLHSVIYRRLTFWRCGKPLIGF